MFRESYSDPQTLYETLKRRGMDLVTVTDHDSIEAGDHLRSHSDFFLSEEVTCVMPSGTKVHVGVYGITERQHLEMQQRRNDIFAFSSYLEEQNLFFSVNHVFSSLTGRRTERDFGLFERLFPGVETMNGYMPPCSNRYARQLAARWQKTAVGGSDSHTLAAAGETYTEVLGVTSVATYLEGLRQGQSRVEGKSGSYCKLTSAVLQIGLAALGENPWGAAALSPLLIAIPIVTFVSFLEELIFADRWARKILSEQANAWNPVSLLDDTP